MNLEIHADDGSLIFAILGKSPAIVGDEAQISDGIRMKYNGSDYRRGASFPDVLYFELTVDRDVPKNSAPRLISSWLSYNLKSRKIGKIVIERREAAFKKWEIRRIIGEVISPKG